MLLLLTVNPLAAQHPLLNSLDLSLFAASEEILVPGQLRASLNLTSDQCNELDRLRDWYQHHAGIIVKATNSQAEKTNTDNGWSLRESLYHTVAMDLMTRELERRIAAILSKDQLQRLDQAIVERDPSQVGGLRLIRLEGAAITEAVGGSEARDAMLASKAKVGGKRGPADPTGIPGHRVIPGYWDAKTGRTLQMDTPRLSVTEPPSPAEKRFWLFDSESHQIRRPQIVSGGLIGSN